MSRTFDPAMLLTPVTDAGDDMPAWEGDEEERENPGDRIGPFILARVLGEGGFGKVWLVEQSGPIRRQVAMKILKPGLDTYEVLRRFQREKESLARMDHPGIARVFDAGATPSGRPFFTMEVVAGQAITDYCLERSLGIPARLALFLKVCHAVQHAHQKGVIHRDLKPSNILVAGETGEAYPKIIDFGVARAISRAGDAPATFATRLHQVLGTPGYMSPEQVEGRGEDVDTRSDIYSLGAILYELLTGTLPVVRPVITPMPSGGAATPRAVDAPSRRITSLRGDSGEIARCFGMPAERLSTCVRGDLDWITLKCLESEPRRRYASVGDLAADIVRHLESRPISARPPRLTYHLGLAVRRNRLAFSLAAAATFTLLAGVCCSSYFFLRERDARLQADARHREAIAARDSATAARKSAEQFIIWSLGDLRDKLKPLGKNELMVDIATNAEAYYRDLPPSEESDTARVHRARICLLLGTVHFQRNEVPKTIGLYRRGLSLVEPVALANPGDSDAQQWHAMLMSRLGDALGAHGHVAESLALRRREIPMVRALAESSPGHADRQRNYCVSLRKLAVCLHNDGQHAEARRAIDFAIDQARRRAPYHVPFALKVKADWEVADGRENQAVALYEEILGLMEPVAVQSPDNVKDLRCTIATRIQLADCQLREGAVESARANLAAAAQLRDHLANVDNTNRELVGDLAHLLRVRGALHAHMDHFDLAVQDFEESFRLFSELRRADPAVVDWQRGLRALAHTAALSAGPAGPSDALRGIAADIQAVSARIGEWDRK